MVERIHKVLWDIPDPPSGAILIEAPCLGKLIHIFPDAGTEQISDIETPSSYAT